MANSTANPGIYGALAVTAAGQAFGVTTTNVTKIQSWQLADDMLSWSSTGVVGIGSAWG